MRSAFLPVTLFNLIAAGVNSRLVCPNLLIRNSSTWVHRVLTFSRVIIRCTDVSGAWPQNEHISDSAIPHFCRCMLVTNPVLNPQYVVHQKPVAVCDSMLFTRNL